MRIEYAETVAELSKERTDLQERISKLRDLSDDYPIEVTLDSNNRYEAQLGPIRNNLLEPLLHDLANIDSRLTHLGVNLDDC